MQKNLHILGLVALFFGCGSPGGPVEKPAEQAPGASAESPEAAAEAINLQGAGATFPYPLYSKWVAEYEKTDPQVRINYQSIGSGGGVRQILERTVDFGASDDAMKDEELAKAPSKLLHFPMTLGAVVVAFNLPGIATLKLTPEAIAGIFAGDIKKWNDAKITADNPGVKLPADAIAVTYRSDGSGTTAVFTEYLSKISPKWKENVGAGKSVKFPVGLGAKGNEGVAGQIKTTPGSVGYIELAYAEQTGLAHASVKNQAGKFVEPALESISAAAASVATNMPEDLRVSIVNAPGDAAYPIAAFTYILAYENQGDAKKGKALAQFMWWAIHDGQALGPALHYAKLPAEVVIKVEEKLRTLKAGDQVLLPSS